MDLLGSILGTMEKPPTATNEQRKSEKGIDSYVRFYSYNDIIGLKFTHPQNIALFRLTYLNQVPGETILLN